jgi:small ligand-binding sensory domain FIST
MGKDNQHEESVMLHAGVGLSTQKDTQGAASEATRIALSRAGCSTADLALVFATTEHGAHYSLLLRTVKELARANNVVGCSAGGVLTTDGEVERAAGVAVLTVRADTFSSRRFFVPQLRSRAHEVGQEVAAAVHPYLDRENLLMVFPDTYNFNPSLFFRGLTEEIPHLPIVGGGASENGTIGETFQFCGDTVSHNAVSGVLLSGEFSHTVAVTQSCQPIGPVHTVTRAHRNVILAIDNRPAFEVFAAAVRPPLSEDLRRAAMVVFVGLPVDPERQRVERGEYVVRNLVGFDPQNGAIAITEEVRTGQKMRFALRDGRGAREDLKQALERQTEQWHSRSPGFGLYFNCIGRGSSLYGFPDLDTSYIKQYVGDIPLIGFFSGCEIAPTGQQLALHQYSGVLVLVGEGMSH